MRNNSNPHTVIGHAAVDSGTIMVVDPCYVRKGLDYDAFCKFMEDAHKSDAPYGELPDVYGIVTSTQFGDGSYPVIAEYDSVRDQANGRPARVTIDFTLGANQFPVGHKSEGYPEAEEGY